MVSLVRWSRSERTLPGEEVDAEFDAHPDCVHLYAFTTNRMSVGEHTGSLSVKLVTHGREQYQLGRRRVTLTPGEVLVVNEGQSYASSIDEPETRSISFFLPTAAAAEALRSARPFDRTPDPDPVDVLQVPFRAGGRLALSVSRLSAAVARPGRPDPESLQELVLETATGALAEARGLVCPDALSDLARRSTREELVARVLRARDLIVDTHGRATLNQMALEAGLSKFHFLRTFQAVFGLTPARFARSLKLERGRARLERGDPARLAARHAGYRSSSAFLRALRRDAP